MSMQAVYAYCVPGKHDGPLCGTLSDGSTNPLNWSMVRASYHAGEWLRDDSSPAKVMCCSEHYPRADTAHVAVCNHCPALHE